MAMVNTGKLYSRVLREQKLGVQPDFEKAARETPKPSMAEEILKAVALVALAAVTEGIGELVAGALIEEGADIAANAMKEMVKTTVSEGLNKGIEVASKASEKSDPLDAFIDWQNAGLDQAADDLEDAWDLGKSAEFLAKYKGNSTQAIKELNLWRERLQEQKERARPLQFEASIRQWADYLVRINIQKQFEPSAKARAQGEKPATDLGSKTPIELWRTPGILTLDLTDPKTPDGTLAITDARMQGLNERLRKELEQMPTPIAQLGIPYTVQIAAFDNMGLFGIYLSRNEGGSVFIQGEVPYDRPRVISWLHARMHPYAEIGAPGSDHDTETAFTAARLILEDTAGKKSLKELGIKLGEG